MVDESQIWEDMKVYQSGVDCCPLSGEPWPVRYRQQAQRRRARKMHRSLVISQEPLSDTVLAEHVKAYGRYPMFWPRPVFKITACDLERSVFPKSCPIYAIDVYTTVA